MKNPIDNPIEDVMHELSVYRTITLVSIIIILVMGAVIYNYIEREKLMQGHIENLEMANNSKNYIHDTINYSN